MNTVASQNLKREKAELGFWLYLMTDMILFASLFATFFVLRNNTAGAGTGTELLDPKYALLLTALLLISSFTSGLALASYRAGRRTPGMMLLCFTIALGLAFLTLEVMEFAALVQEGESWKESAFLSSFYTLVGTHGLHILVGLIWGSVLAVYLNSRAISHDSLRKLTLFTYFWHFLDVVWIFVFSIVYLIGSLS
jgi:cytochrome o ubiquinol oxidase subunit 3